MGGSTSTTNKIKNAVAHAIFMGPVFSQWCKQTFVKLRDTRRVSFALLLVGFNHMLWKSKTRLTPISTASVLSPLD